MSQEVYFDKGHDISTQPVAKRMKRTCFECGKKLTIALAKDNTTILSGGYYYGKLRIHKEDKAAPEPPITTAELWTCSECEEEDNASKSIPK